MSQLPTVDLSAFRRDPSSAEAAATADQLRQACHDPGFVYLTGHGVDPVLEEDLWEAGRAFFALSGAERKALAIENSPAFRGYTILGDERTGGTADWRDQLDLGPEQDAAPPDAQPPWRRLRGPNQWPSSLPGMQHSVMAWMNQMESLGLTALRALACGLEQPIDRFDHGFVPTSDAHVKIIRYPSQPDHSAADGQGVGLHHDSGLLTFILQDDVGGLQVQLGDGLVDVEPVPGTYVMNLGEMLQSATSGYLRATPHRVQSPPSGRERLSVAFFFNPRFESRFDPIALPPELAASATGGDQGAFGDPVHTLFGENNLKIRLRSHPDVAARHYSDVITD